MNHRVTVIQKHLSQYRKRFFQLARDELKSAGVTLDLIYGRSKDKTFIGTPEILVDRKLGEHRFILGVRHLNLDSDP